LGCWIAYQLGVAILVAAGGGRHRFGIGGTTNRRSEGAELDLGGWGSNHGHASERILGHKRTTPDLAQKNFGARGVVLVWTLALACRVPCGPEAVWHATPPFSLSYFQLGKAISHLGDLELLLTRIFLQLHLHPTSFFSNSGELLRRV
jgi:hypothetical protein